VPLVGHAFEAAGHDPAQAKIAINTHAFVGETSAEVDKAFAHAYPAMMNRIGRERGWPPSGRPEHDALRSPRGALAVEVSRRERPARHAWLHQIADLHQ